MYESPHIKHKHGAPKHVKFALITVSTSRYYAKKRNENIQDVSYQVAQSLIREKGYSITIYKIVPDNSREILKTITEILERDDVDVIVTMGGTGPAPSDITIETLRPLFEKELEGFGQVFRLLSYQEIGSAAFLSNATAGIVSGKLIFCLPGSPGAAKLAFEKLILPEVGHILALMRS